MIFLLIIMMYHNAAVRCGITAFPIYCVLTHVTSSQVRSHFAVILL